MAALKSGRSKRGRVLLRLGRHTRQANYWIVGQITLLVLKVLRLLPPDKALDFADRFARRFGPYFGRHRLALSNLALAYPEKPAEEIGCIASGMWANLARLAAEYVFLDTLFDFDPARPEAGRVEVAGVDKFLKIAADKRPHIIFTGHLGCFEMLPVAAAAYRLDITALFRPPNNPYIAKYVFSARSEAMGDLLASQVGAAFALSRILGEGGNVGMLVDQRFNGGVDTLFFGAECQTSPLLPKLARHHEPDVYPARCIRLPGNRYRLEIEDRLDLPRNEQGQIDVEASAQLLNDVVERWVREYPEQWIWIHKRWGRTDKRWRWRLRNKPKATSP